MGNSRRQVQRYRHALNRLSEREDVRDAPSRYEACGLTLVKCRGGPEEYGVHAGYPVPGSELDYDSDVPEAVRGLRPPLRRQQQGAEADDREKDSGIRESPVLTDTVLLDDAFAEMEPRELGRGRLSAISGRKWRTK